LKTFKLSCKNCKKIFYSNGANQKYTNKDKQTNNKCCNECWDKLETIRLSWPKY